MFTDEILKTVSFPRKVSLRESKNVDLLCRDRYVGRNNFSSHSYGEKYFLAPENKYYKLINEFYNQTGIPVVINTSMNVKGEPIVNTPENAFDCFMGTELDVLVIENCYLNKKDQVVSLKKDYNI